MAGGSRSTGDDLYDVAIVGTGPAGAAAALRALMLAPDLRVAIIDRSSFPRDKICGDGISPYSVRLLHHLGAGEVLVAGERFDRLWIRGPGGGSASGTVDEPGYVMPRATFDHRLVLAAIRRGAVPVTERVTHLERRRDGRVVLNDHLAARVVIGADGANSVVRRTIGRAPQAARHLGVALRGYAKLTAPETALRFWFPPDPWPAYVWCFPGPGLQANVGLVVFGMRNTTRDRMSATMARVLPDLELDPDTVHGHRLPLSTARPDPADGNVLLVGDAAALVNPVSGEGIAAALVSGALAGACAARFPEAAGSRYRAALRHHLGRHLRHTRLAARLYATPATVDAALRAVSRSSRLFAELVEVTVGTGHVSPGTAARARLRSITHGAG